MTEVSGKSLIRNKLGMHARAAAVFVLKAQQFEADIRVCKDDIDVSGKSIMGILQLAAVQGDEIEIMARGQDGSSALQALQGLVADRFGEEE